MTKNEDKRSRMCFVVGPIGVRNSEERIHADNLFHDVIVPALRPLGFEQSAIIRADHLENPGSINEQVINLILDADLVVADLSFHNPNAFYELGIADTSGKVVLSFCREGDGIPFDRLQDRTIVADIGIWQEKDRAREQLQRFAEKALEPNFKVSNPVTHARGFASLRTSADPKDKLIADMERRIEALEQSTGPEGLGIGEWSKGLFGGARPPEDLQLKTLNKDSEVFADVNGKLGKPSYAPLTEEQIQECIGAFNVEALEGILVGLNQLRRGRNLTKASSRYVDFVKKKVLEAVGDQTS